MRSCYRLDPMEAAVCKVLNLLIFKKRRIKINKLLNILKKIIFMHRSFERRMQNIFFQLIYVFFVLLFFFF